jgi:hypothetical protein
MQIQLSWQIEPKLAMAKYQHQPLKSSPPMVSKIHNTFVASERSKDTQDDRHIGVRGKEFHKNGYQTVRYVTSTPKSQSLRVRLPTPFFYPLPTLPSQHSLPSPRRACPTGPAAESSHHSRHRSCSVFHGRYCNLDQELLLPLVSSST